MIIIREEKKALFFLVDVATPVIPFGINFGGSRNKGVNFYCLVDSIGSSLVNVICAITALPP